MKNFAFGIICLFMININLFSQSKIGRIHFDQNEQKLDKFLPNKICLKLSNEGVINFNNVNNSINKKLFGIKIIDNLLAEFGVINIKQKYPIFDKTPKTKKRLELSKIYEIDFSRLSDPFILIDRLSKLTEIQYAEPVYSYKTDAIPNDTHYQSQLYFSRIKAAEAWDIHKGDNGPEILIGICDSGVEWYHGDLVANVKQNLGEDLNGDGSVIKFINNKWVFDPADIDGLDTDGNGFTDDFVGWNFNTDDDTSENDPNASAINSHGTHVAGLAAAATHNEKGIASISWNFKFIPTKHANNVDEEDRSFYNTYDGIVYLTDYGVDIINCSWGNTTFLSSSEDVINYALEQGVVLFAAAGNDDDEYLHYPSDYEGVISVAALNFEDEKASYSNYGYHIDLSIPGGDHVQNGQMLSTIPDNNYGYKVGTSMASPLAAGAFALLKSYRNNWTNDSLIKQFLGSADNIDSVNPDYLSKLGYGKINIYEALNTINKDISKKLKLCIYDVKLENNLGGRIIEPGKEYNFSFVIRNYNTIYGSDNLKYSIVSDNPNVSVINGDSIVQINPNGGFASIENINVKISDDVDGYEAFTLYIFFENKDGIEVGTKFEHSNFIIADDDYCKTFELSNGYYIKRVEIGIIDNYTNSFSNHNNFKYLETDIILEKEYTMEITTSRIFPSDTIMTWIDLNQNFTFDDDELFESRSINDSLFIVKIYISQLDDFKFGKTRMRLRLTSFMDLKPCDTISYGETEDYTINIIEPEGQYIPSRLMTWGHNFHGQLGDGTKKDKVIPIEIIDKIKWIQVALGYGHTVALNYDGSLWACGSNWAGQLGDNSNINKDTLVRIGQSNDWAMIATGYEHTLALKKDGTLWAWGNNFYGQLGNGTTTNSKTPTKVGNDSDWRYISGGDHHSIGIKSDSSLWIWGANTHGAIGDGTTLNKLVPTKIEQNAKWIKGDGGASHTIGLKSDSTIWAWGYNMDGQLGDGTNQRKLSPTKISNDKFRDIATGGNHSLAIKSDTSLWAWGLNGNGQLGDSTTLNKFTPTKIGNANNWKFISGGANHTLALKSDSTLWAWGSNWAGQLGDSTLSNRSFPHQSGTKRNWSMATAGYYHSSGIIGNIPDKFFIPSLISPIDNAQLKTSYTKLKWENISNGTSYDVQISLDSTFTNSAQTLNTQFTEKLIVDLIIDTTYHWKVRARNSSMIGEWSEVWKFYNVSSFWQDIPLNNGWNTISSYLKPNSPDSLQYICSKISDKLLIMKNIKGQVYIPQYNINSIVNWQFAHGYQLYMTGADTLRIFGDKIDTENNGILLNAGWNLVSYLLDYEKDAAEALISVTGNNNLVIAKNLKGQVFIPSYGINTIGNMKPGIGYNIYVIANGVLMYPR